MFREKKYSLVGKGSEELVCKHIGVSKWWWWTSFYRDNNIYKAIFDKGERRWSYERACNDTTYDVWLDLANLAKELLLSEDEL